jgi:membrane-associated HD superfamily phosphohydrolase
MKKIILTSEQVVTILKMYNEELLGSHTISIKLNINKQIILRTLRENNVSLGPSGRRDIGGKKVADKKWRNNNKEYMSEKSKKWYSENKDKWNKYIKEYRENNIDKIREIKRNYERTRKANDPIYKLINNFRTAIYQVLKENNVQKNGHYFDILKYSPENLIEHLESKFKDNMTWDNYGEWHVDHIKPISLFQITEIGDNEFMSCWSLENLQPLWGEENIRKSNKII